jgi:uncharacterized RDD family membrane protein YckC
MTSHVTDGYDPEQSDRATAGGRRRSLFDPIGRIVETVVPTVTHAVDVDELVRRIDVDEVVRRIDIQSMLSRIDVDDIVRRVDVDAIVSRIDVNELLGRADVDALVSRVDVDALLNRVDIDALTARVDVDALLARVDVDGLVRRIDVDGLVGRVDADTLLDRIDFDGLLGRVEVNELLERIDVDRLIRRVDIDAVMTRVDIDAVVDRVDIDRVVQRADLAGVVAESTRGITARTLDLVRRQVAGIDEIITRVAARLVRRDPATDPEGPVALLDLPQPPRRGRDRPSITGHYAGPVARTAALALDWTTMAFLFGVFTAMTSWILDVLNGGDGAGITVDRVRSALVFGVWAFVYFAVPMAFTGRTFAKAVVGLRVVRSDGAPLHVDQAAIRVLVLPFSFLLLGLGLVGAVFGRRRRALHDLAARSVEVIDWGDRPAAIPTPLNEWLERRREAEPTQPSGTLEPGR